METQELLRRIYLYYGEVEAQLDAAKTDSAWAYWKGEEAALEWTRDIITENEKTKWGELDLKQFQPKA